MKIRELYKHEIYIIMPRMTYTGFEFLHFSEVLHKYNDRYFSVGKAQCNRQCPFYAPRESGVSCKHTRFNF